MERGVERLVYLAALSLAGVALIDGILTAFGTVYDARLFAALQRAERGKEALALNAR